MGQEKPEPVERLLYFPLKDIGGKTVLKIARYTGN